MIKKQTSWWFRLGQLAALGGMALLGLFDLYARLVIPETTELTLLGLAQVLTAVATAAVWLPAHPQDSKSLAAKATLLALWSISMTVGDVLLSGQYGDGDSGSWGLAESVGLLGVLMVVARRAPASLVVQTLIVLGLALGMQPLRSGFSPEEAIVFSLLLVLAGSAAVATGVFLRVQESGRAQQLASVRAEQRAEFARDLHDFIAHHVTGIVVQAQGARMIGERDPARAMQALEQIENAGAETMTAMRRMVGVLRGQGADPDAPLAPLAGIDELVPLIETFSASAPPVARLHIDGDVSGLPVEVSSSAYRVVMEALTNVRQHAVGAEVVDVWVRNTPNWLLVRVADDGTPAKTTGPRERQGFGLVGLEERVRAIGGRIQSGPGIDGGWIVDAALPLTREVIL
jgi:signal transduction histidine kinase